MDKIFPIGMMFVFCYDFFRCIRTIKSENRTRLMPYITRGIIDLILALISVSVLFK